MSQSIVVPELDGAIYPYVLNDQELDEEGIYLFKAIPRAAEEFHPDHRQLHLAETETEC